MICTLSLKGIETLTVSPREKRKEEKGWRMEFFYVPDDRNSKFEQYALLFSKPAKNQRVKCVRILKINQRKCIIYITQNAHKIVDFFSENDTLKD